jgi:uncharacterized membrane protein YjjP (DUF1212 family)
MVEAANLERSDPARDALRQLLVELGTAMVAAGDAVDNVEDSLRRIVAAFGIEDVQIALLPTSMFIEMGGGHSSSVQFSAQVGPPLRLDQIGELYELVKDLEHRRLTPDAGLERLRNIYRRRPAFGWPLRVLGHGVLTAGLALLLQPTPTGVAVGFVLGLLVGLLKLPNLPTLRLIFPIVAAFLIAVVVFGAARFLHIDNPIRLLVAPLVTFLPGALLAVATMELAAGEMVSGSSRLVSGVVQLALLAFGIVAGAALVNAPQSYLLDHKVAGLGYWAAWLGVFVFAFGVFLHFSAPVSSLPWLLLVLVAAFAGQSVGSALFGGELSGFFGALVMTPLALWVERLRRGPPKLVTFLPAFWLLVPGATGLIGVTTIVGTGANVATSVFRDTLGSIIAISLGVLIGAAAFKTTNVGARYLGRAVRWPRTEP